MMSGHQDFNKKLYYSVKKNVQQSLSKTSCFAIKSKQAIEAEQKRLVSNVGAIKNIDIDFAEKKAIVRVEKDLVDCPQVNVKLATDHVLRGVFAGLFSAAFDENVECIETHCTALGDDACEFVVKRQYQFDFSDRLLLNQLELDI